MRPGLLLQVAKVRGEINRWLTHWRTEIQAETCPRHLDCARVLCEELLAKMVRIQGYETLETRGYEDAIARLVDKQAGAWSPEPLKKAKPRLSLVPPAQEGT